MNNYTRKDAEAVSVCTLKMLLQSQGKKTTGKKEILIERLLSDINDPINEKQRRGRSPKAVSSKVSTSKAVSSKVSSKSPVSKRPRGRPPGVRSVGRPKKILNT